MLKKLFAIFLSIVFLFLLLLFIKVYNMVFKPNVIIQGNEQYDIFIKTNSTIDDVYNLLIDSSLIKNIESFKWVAEKKNYKNHLKPGKYNLKYGMSNNELVNMLRSGNQSPVNLVFNNIRTKEELAGRIAMQIEADSMDLLYKLNNPELLKKYNLNENTILSIFIPNTYEFYWNTTANQFFDRMYKEFEKFWTKSRNEKISRTGLSKIDVIILASIVEQETQMNEEKARLAGVYLNRLNRGMRLQADPTVKFAHGNFEIKRVLTEHLSINSPYNTYKYKGLPPGPICIPSISSIDAVLNYENHQYLFFCAKDDFSGFHAFAKTLDQHNINANKYQQALNRNRVYN